MNQLREYKDGMTTEHRLPGTVIPSATNRSKDGKGPIDNESLGADFDIQNAVEHVIVECDEAGYSVKSTVLDKAALERLIKANRQGPGWKGRVMSYDEAVSAVAAKPVLRAGPVAATLTMPTSSGAETTVAVPMPLLLTAQPKIKVGFAGAFGKINFSYAQVFRHDIFLVLVQESAEGDFYEPPGERSQAMQVTVYEENCTYACFPCAHIPFPGGRSAVTILLVDDGKEGDDHGEAR